MLLLGVPSTPAQTGQDARCAAFSGQAHGLCTAAVSEGCFDGVQSPDCDDLTSNWNERCRVCAGVPPWITCPCANTSAVQLHAEFLQLPFDGQPSTPACMATSTNQFVRRFDEAAGLNSLPSVLVQVRLEFTGKWRCQYELRGPSNEVLYVVSNSDITEAEAEACRADIVLLMTQLTDCP
jgi:hypothetical protein